MLLRLEIFNLRFKFLYLSTDPTDILVGDTRWEILLCGRLGMMMMMTVNLTLCDPITFSFELLYMWEISCSHSAFIYNLSSNFTHADRFLLSIAFSMSLLLDCALESLSHESRSIIIYVIRNHHQPEYVHYWTRHLHLTVACYSHDVVDWYCRYWIAII